jgi:phosphohistidine phosphatase
MKTLYIIRHAKSSWDFPGLPDYERPLMEVGRTRTRLIIQFLIEQEARPGLILCSHANRARETAVMVAEGLTYPAENIRVEPSIYHGNEDDLLSLIVALPDELDSVMIVGHNPTLTSVANHFLHEPIEWLPTSGIACFEFHTDLWENIKTAKKRTKFVISPKKLKEGKK